MPIAEVYRMASKFSGCQSPKIAGILDVPARGMPKFSGGKAATNFAIFQDFGAKTGGKFAARMCAAAIGTAS